MAPPLPGKRQSYPHTHTHMQRMSRWWLLTLDLHTSQCDGATLSRGFKSVIPPATVPPPHIYCGAFCAEWQMVMCDIKKKKSYAHLADIITVSMEQSGLIVRWQTPLMRLKAEETSAGATPLIPKCPTTNLTFRKNLFHNRNQMLQAALTFSRCLDAVVLFLTLIPHPVSSLSSPRPGLLFDSFLSFYFLLFIIWTSFVHSDSCFFVFLPPPPPQFPSHILVPEALQFISMTFDCQTRTCSKWPNSTLLWHEGKIAYSTTPLFLLFYLPLVILTSLGLSISLQLNN